MDRTKHGDAKQEIARLGGQVSDTVAFGAKDDGQGAGQFCVEERLAGLVIACAGNPYAGILEFNQGVAEIVGLDDGERFRGAHSYLTHGFVDWSRVLLGDDDKGATCAFGRTDAGPEVMRVLNTIENQDEWILMFGEQGRNVPLIIKFERLI